VKVHIGTYYLQHPTLGTDKLELMPIPDVPIPDLIKSEEENSRVRKFLKRTPAVREKFKIVKIEISQRG